MIYTSQQMSLKILNATSSDSPTSTLAGMKSLKYEKREYMSFRYYCSSYDPSGRYGWVRLILKNTMGLNKTDKS